MIPVGLVLALFGLGIMLPNEIGGVVIGGLPLVTGLYLLSKGAGIEATVNKVIQEMRDNADAAMFSSLLWTATVFSAIFAVAEGYREYNIQESTVVSSVLWLEVIHSALAWIVIAFLTSTAGFLLLRLKRGSFSGRLLILGIFAMVVYSFVDTALVISTRVLRGESYEFSVQEIINDLQYPMIWVVVLWMAMTIVRSLRTRQAQTERYWGI
jgi:uncharacterized membrane protein